jgi:hypothetical protein
MGTLGIANPEGTEELGLEALAFSEEAKPGIGVYVAGVGGLLLSVGGFLLAGWRKGDTLAE